MNKAAANNVFVKWLLDPIFSAKNHYSASQVSEATYFQMQPLHKYPTVSGNAKTATQYQFLQLLFQVH